MERRYQSCCIISICTCNLQGLIHQNLQTACVPLAASVQLLEHPVWLVTLLPSWMHLSNTSHVLSSAEAYGESSSANTIASFTSRCNAPQSASRTSRNLFACGHTIAMSAVFLRCSSSRIGQEPSSGRWTPRQALCICGMAYVWLLILFRFILTCNVRLYVAVHLGAKSGASETSVITCLCWMSTPLF